jgi:type I restriction enzyme S subunit
MSEQYLVCRTAFYNCYYEKIGKEVKNITSELPFEIPDNWTWIRLSNYCYLNGGYAFKSNNFSNEGIRVIRISDFDENGIKSKEIKRYPYSSEMDKSKIEVNDIIVCMTGGTVGKSLYIKQLEEPSYLNQRVALIRTKDKLSDYLANVFKSPYIQELVKDNITSTNDNISMNFLNNILIPIPPFNEQLRIQSKLLYCEPLIKNYEYLERQLTQLESNFEERLKASILQYAIEGKLVKQNPNDEPASVLLERIKAEKEKLISEGKIKRDKNDSIIEQSDDKNYYACYGINAPSQWCICCLSSISIKIVDGNHNPPRGIDHLCEYKMLSSLNIDNNGLVNLSSVRYLTREQFIDENKRTNIQLNDILLTTVGSLGRCFVLNKVIPVAFQRSVSVITTLINPQFLRLFFLSPSFQKYMQLNAKGTAQKGFYLNQLSDSLIAFPSLKEQDLIVKMVESILKVLS